MKKSWLIGFIIVIGLIVGGCNKPVVNDSPATVVKKYYDAILKGDSKTYSELHTDPEDILRLHKNESMQYKKEREEMYGKIERYEEIINGDEATVNVIGIPNREKLIKVDGKWKIKD